MSSQYKKFVFLLIIILIQSLAVFEDNYALCVEMEIDEIIITGSRTYKKSSEEYGGLVVVNEDSLDLMGIRDIGEIVNFLTFNSGSEFNTDVFTQNLSAGTSNFNFRGLGLGSTLVLLNGRRHTVSGGVADDGSSFVDINSLVPLNTVKRIEILKDGGSALYGSDAVAGVANIITKDAVQGFQMDGYLGSTTKSSQEDVNLSMLYGNTSENFNFVASVGYTSRSWLPSPLRDFTLGKGLSSFGQPGAFILLERSPTFPDLPFGDDIAVSVIDPDCEAAGGVKNEILPGSGLGTCKFDFSSYYHLIPRERRWLGHFSMLMEKRSYDVFLEGGIVRSKTLRGTSPSFPILNLVTVPADNPGNIYKVPSLFLGRPLGSNSKRNLVSHKSDTERLAFGVRGESFYDWDWELSLSYSRNRHLVVIEDALADQFNLSLQGKGGPNRNLFFNPFGSSSLVRPGDSRYNSQEVISSFLSNVNYDYRPSLFSSNIGFTRTLLVAQNFSLDLALGGELRYEKINGLHDDNFNRENYLFLIGGPDFSGSQNIFALYAELRSSLSDNSEIQFSIRHDNYEKGISSTDPKINVLWKPRKWLTNYFSFGTSFRAPSVFQKFSSQTVLQNIRDPITKSSVFRGVRTSGTDSLKPETANILNFGMDFKPLEGLQFKLEHWRYSFKNLIIKESAQEIIDVNPFDKRIIRESGQILGVNVNYKNANSVRTNGFDLLASYKYTFLNNNSIQFSGDVTFVDKYLIDDGLKNQSRNVAGFRNFRNFARSLPQWRSNLGIVWSANTIDYLVRLRSVSGYFDDQNNLPIKGQITFDGQIRLKLDSLVRFGDGSGANLLTLGVINIFNKMPPDVNTVVGYDSKVHDPRGRYVYFRIGSEF